MASNNRESIAPPRELLVSWLARLYKHGLTTTTGGNLSMVDDDGIFYITPSVGDKAIVPPENIALCRKGQTEGETEFEGPVPPSMEWPLRAVLHAHSMTLMAFSLARAEFSNGCDVRLPDTRVLLGGYQACGKCAFVKYPMPGSQEPAASCKEFFQETNAKCLILQNHGVVVVGATLHEAYDRFVSLEYLAKSMVHAIPLGVSPKQIPSNVLKYAVDPDNTSPDNPFPRQYCQLQRMEGNSTM